MMRQGPHLKRGRGRGNNRRVGTPNRNQTFDSNGPEVRIRGNAYQVHEKYMVLARDASTSGDRVLAESYFQHAEHYFRIMAAFGDEPGLEAARPRDNGAAHDSFDGGTPVFPEGPQPDMEQPVGPQQPVHQASLLDDIDDENKDLSSNPQPDITPARRPSLRRRGNGADRSTAVSGNGETGPAAENVTVIEAAGGAAETTAAAPRKRRTRAARPVTPPASANGEPETSDD